MPITLLRKRTVPSTPPSLVKLGGPRRLGEHRSVELETDQGPGAEGDVRRVVGLAIGTPTTADAVSCEPTATTGTDAADPLGHGGQQVADEVARVDEVGEEGRVGGRAGSISSVSHCPGRDVEQPGGRGVGALGDRGSR